MKLYYSQTPNPYKACAVAKYLQLPVEFVPVDLGRGEHKQPDYMAVNPNGKTPALEDGDVRLWEAHAIMAYYGGVFHSAQAISGKIFGKAAMFQWDNRLAQQYFFGTRMQKMQKKRSFSGTNDMRMQKNESVLGCMRSRKTRI